MRKSELMYHLFGKKEGQCKDCEHLVFYKHHDKTVRKCEVYGDTRSEATDWAGKYDACGLFPDKPYNGKPVVRTVRGEKKQEENMEGQISLFDLLEEKPARKITLGYLRSKEEAERLKGDVIPFQNLEKYIGKYVLYEMPRVGMTDYKVVKITSYHKNCDKIYDANGEVIGTCDRVGGSDDKRYETENSWASEQWFQNGRYHDADNKFLWLIYEIKE